MAAKLSPVLNSQIFDANGNPLIGGTIETYLAGSSTPLNTFTDVNGLITQTNPIVLNALGQSANLIWLTSGSLYKFIVKDSLGNVQNTLDNIQGVNELVVNLDEWISSAITPTYINATTFTLSGDQTSIYQIGRRLRLSVTAGTLYGTVQSAIYGASTTVIVKLDSGVIDAGLSSLSYGILTPDNSSLPSIFEDYRQTIIATATTTPLWDAVGKIQDWTGTPTITNFPAAPQAGSQRIVYPAAGTVITDNANIDVQGNVSYTVVAGDELTITAITTTTFYVTIKRKDGLAISTASISKNIIINGGFTINQRGYVSSAALASGSYGHDRWKAGASGGDYSFTQLASNTQITIAANKTLIQVIEDKNVQDTSYVLSWTGTAQARVGLNGASPSGAYASSPLIITGQTAGQSLSVEFGNGASAGTLSNVQLEYGSTAGVMEKRLYQDELELCQRYCQIAPINALKTTAVLSAAGWVLSASWAMVSSMRTTPTSNTPTWALTLLNTPTLSLDAGSIYAVATATTNGTCAFNNSSAIILSAEL